MNLPTTSSPRELSKPPTPPAIQPTIHPPLVTPPRPVLKGKYISFFNIFHVFFKFVDVHVGDQALGICELEIWSFCRIGLVGKGEGGCGGFGLVVEDYDETESMGLKGIRGI